RTNDTATDAAMSGAWAQKMTLQPTASTSGPPSARPTTGPPATTSDQNPSALERSAGRNSRLMIASEQGPATAPSAAPATRNAMSDPPDHAIAQASENSAAPDMPSRYTRRWPWRSPSLPAVVPISANATVGPEMTHTR